MEKVGFELREEAIIRQREREKEKFIRRRQI
jgi:hypothetical protein